MNCLDESNPLTHAPSTTPPDPFAGLGSRAWWKRLFSREALTPYEAALARAVLLREREP